MVKPEREHEMAEAIARAEEEDDIEDTSRPYVRPRPPRRSAGDVYTFRLPKERKDQLREAAERRGVPPATLIRQWVELQLDYEAKHQAAVASAEDLKIDALLQGSFTRSSVLGRLKDADFGLLSEQASEEELVSLMLLGSLVPDLTTLGRDVHRRATSALDDLTEALDGVVGLIGSSKLLTFLEVKSRPAEGRRAEIKGSRTVSVIVGSNDEGRNERHVLPNPTGGWDVKAPGARRVSLHAKTQEDAVRRAREIVENAGGGEVVIHEGDGEALASDAASSAEDSRYPCELK